MEGEAVKRILDAAKQPLVMQVNGAEVLAVPSGWSQERAVLPPIAESLGLQTLNGVADYLKANRDGLALEEQLIVISPTDVVVVQVVDDTKRRTVWVGARVLPFDSGRWERYQPVEDFIVGMQSQFVQSSERDDLLQFISSVREESVRQSDDDGFSQEVTTARGVAIKGRDKVPSPVALRPWRTFREVEQPVTKFVVRVKAGGDGPLVALFAADGGSWKLDAAESIHAWLLEHVPAEVAILR